MKILLVDDNNSITDLLSKFFKMKGHECTATNSGKEGLSLCINKKFDVIILDLSMPEFTGKDFMESIVHEGKIDEQKIIIFTSMPLGGIDIGKNNSGICAVLQKPVSLDTILKTVESVYAVA